MLRKQIRVGDVLYWQESGDWNRASLYDAARVTVLAVEPHRPDTYGPGDYVPGRPRSTKDMLVSFERRNADGSGFDPAIRRLVRVADLRGPWEETLAARLAMEAAKRDRAREDREKRETVAVAVEAAIERAMRSSFTTARNATSSFDNRSMALARVSVSLADFERMLNRLDELEQAAQELIGEREAEGEEYFTAAPGN